MGVLPDSPPAPDEPPARNGLVALKSGTPLMEAAQTIGIDLPLKALAWQDTSGQTWLGYNDPAWLTARHGIEGPGAIAATAMRTMLSAVTRSAAMP